MVNRKAEHMSKTSVEVSQSQDETLGTDHLGSIETKGPETEAITPSDMLPQDSRKSKFLLELVLLEDPKVNDEVTPPVTKYHLQQQTVAYFTINGKEMPTIQSRSLWLKLVGDNPLALDKEDTFELNIKNTRLTKSSWLSDKDDPDSEVYYTHWVTPKDFPMPAGHEPAEW